jgi:hypothetical protein
MALQRKGRTALLALGVVRRDEFDQCRPRHDFVHLLQELALAGFLHAQAQIEGGLFHGINDAGWDLRQAHKGWSYAELPYCREKC